MSTDTKLLPAATGIHAIDEMDLAPLAALKPRQRGTSRLKSAKNLRSLYQQLVRDDEPSAIKRARVQAMVDGEPPYSQTWLNANGQGSRANANFLVGRDLITKANNGFNDIITSVQNLIGVVVETGEPAERLAKARILATEATRTFRKWPSFMPNFMRLVDLFNTHGVGIAFFQDARDFRFSVCGFGNFLIPRQTEACEDSILYAVARKDMMVTELYQKIENEAVATALGWNVPAMKAAIAKATTRRSATDSSDAEHRQQEIRNNDVMSDRMYEHVPIIHGYVKEFDADGKTKISFFMAEKDNAEGDFLFKHLNRYGSAEEAYIFFCYGVGNGTFHSIRGMGDMIFALIQLLNRLMCQMADSAMLGSSMILEYESDKALQDLSVQYFGPYAIMPQGMTVVSHAAPDATRVSTPVLNEVKGMLQNASSRYMTPNSQQSGDAYQNKTNAEASLENISSGDSGALDLFYCSLERTFREMFRRLVEGPKSDPLVAEFHKRIAAAGVTPEDLKAIDHASTFAVRAFGAGNPASRTLGFRRLMELYPNLDEIGRKHLLYQVVADIVGFQNVDGFVSLSDQPRLNGEASLAMLENILLMQGNPIEVLSYQMHATHAQIHIPPLMEVLEGVENGQIDPMQVLPGMHESLNHLAAHGEQLAQDPSQAAIYGQVAEAVNNLNQVVTNMDRKIKAEQRQQAEAGAAAEQGQQPQPDATAQIEEMKLATAQFKHDLAVRLGELKLATAQAAAQQNLALNDIKGAEQVRKRIAYPASDYAQRR